MPIRPDLKNQRVLVLGASSGLGRAIGMQASDAGARVSFAARRLDKLERAAAEAMERASKVGTAIAVRCDVRDPKSIDAALAETVERFGGLDALVYSTGMSPLAMLDEASASEWRAVLETNLVGASMVTAAALPHLQKSRGRAVYISSYAVRQSLPGLGLYRVSKVGLDALIECWRLEQPDVDFTRVVVGNTADTEFASAWDPQRTRAALEVWTQRNLFPSATMMPIGSLAEAVVGVLAATGYVDDIAVMPRARDHSTRPNPP